MTRSAVHLALCLGLLACSQQEPAPQPETAGESPTSQTAPRKPAEPARSEPQASEGGPPQDVQPGDVERGRELYANYCASCHGVGGAGDGPLAASLDPKPVAHSDGTYMNALSDEHLRTVIEKGGPAVGKSPLMAPWGGTLDAQQIRDVIAYVRSLAEPPYRSAGP